MASVVVHDTPASLGAAVAAEMLALVRRNPHVVWGLATGSTPLPVYAALAAQLREDPCDLRFVRTFNLDEYLGLPAGHDQTYRHFMDTNLFEALAQWGLARHNTHFPRVGHDYDAEIRAAGGLDLLLLGVGVNGHVGFNEPGTPFDTTTHVVDLTPETRTSNARFFGGHVEAVPTQAITMGVATILAAKRVRLLATGPGKAAIMARTLASQPTPEVPATALHRHADVQFHLDREAAAGRP